jgi:hypothetical protein
MLYVNDYNLYALRNNIRVIKLRRACSTHGRHENCIKCSSKTRRQENSEERDRWEDNIRLDLREIGWEGVGGTHLAQDRDQGQALVNTVMKLRVP